MGRHVASVTLENSVPLTPVNCGGWSTLKGGQPMAVPAFLRFSTADREHPCKKLAITDDLLVACGPTFADIGVDASFACIPVEFKRAALAPTARHSLSTPRRGLPYSGRNHTKTQFC